MKLLIANYTGSDGNNNGRVFYKHPATRRSILLGSKEHFINTRYFLGIPQTLYGMKYTYNGTKYRSTSKPSIFFVEDQKLTKKTQLYVPPLPNLYVNGNVCMGTATGMRAADLPGLMNTFVKRFWESKFNMDLNQALQPALGNTIIGLDARLLYTSWARKSKNPDWSFWEKDFKCISPTPFDDIDDQFPYYSSSLDLQWSVQTDFDTFNGTYEECLERF